MELQVGSIVNGKVTSITKFGAFVQLEQGGSGLVHISEVANTFVNDVHDFLQEGQEVKALVLSTENGKINLSIKKTQPRPAGGARSGPMRSAAAAPRPAFAGAPRAAAPRVAATPANLEAASGETLPPSGDQLFEDKLKRFLSASEGKMADLNRSRDGHRGRHKR